MSLATIVFTIASLHINDSRHYNQINPGVGVEWAIDDASHVGAGAYLNSSGRWSIYGSLGRAWTRHRYGVGAELGLVTGYRYPVIPLAFPYITFSSGRFAVKINVLPIRRPIIGVQLRIAY